MRQADPIQLHYARLGSYDPLLLIHGLGSSARDWEHQVPVLANHYQLLIPDLRGHGCSPKPAGQRLALPGLRLRGDRLERSGQLAIEAFLTTLAASFAAELLCVLGFMLDGRPFNVQYDMRRVLY